MDRIDDSTECAHKWIDSYTMMGHAKIPVIRCAHCRKILKVNARIKTDIDQSDYKTRQERVEQLISEIKKHYSNDESYDTDGFDDQWGA